MTFLGPFARVGESMRACNYIISSLQFKRSLEYSRISALEKLGQKSYSSPLIYEVDFDNLSTLGAEAIFCPKTKKIHLIIK